MPSSVAAHAELVSSTPADGAELGSPPRELRLVFSEAPTPGSVSVRDDADGKHWSGQQREQRSHRSGGAEVLEKPVDHEVLLWAFNNADAGQTS